ncbi:MAG: DUF2779 domain-containing protein [Syntrophales bacterium LBB04]|nr:DUF2779 domain-containing protein [Syntrophales bacterium LBB04]
MKPTNCFFINDLTAEVMNRQSTISGEIKKQRSMLAGNMPTIGIGKHCTSPYECNFIGTCWPKLPTDSIFDIRGRMDARFSLYEKGILSMYDVPPENLSANQAMQVNANRNNHVIWNHGQLKSFKDALWYPLYYLDFETFSLAIPPFDGTRPYEQIPFQYSLHYQESPGDTLKHHEYLAKPNIDPRREVAEKLISEIPDGACVLVYNKTFEKMVLRSMAKWLPEHAGKIGVIIDNIRDLADPFRKKDIYHWQQSGSWSLKYVLPAMLPEMTYDHLEIQDGGMASEAFSTMNLSDDPEEVERIRKALLEYCRMDTLAMVRILEKLS